MDFSLVAISWVWTVLLIIIASVLFYCFLPSPRPFWEKYGVRSIPRRSFLSTIIKAFTNMEIHLNDLEKSKKYGKIYGEQELGLDLLTISDLDLLRDILIKDFPNFSDRTVVPSRDPLVDTMLTMLNGEAWKRVRCIITPVFSTGKIKRMTDIIVDSARVMAGNLAKKAGNPVNVKEYFNTFTMDVIASTAFAVKLHSYQDPNNKFLREAKKIFPTSISWRFALTILFPKISKFFDIPMFDTSVTKFFKQVTLEIIEERKTTGKTGNDFLQLLMDCAKEVEESEKNGLREKGEQNFDKLDVDVFGDDVSQIIKMTKETKTLTHDELIAQCIMFFLVGYVTTSATLTFTAYSLAMNPEIQEKLRKEVAAVILEHDGKITYEGVQSMKYLDSVISETLRMYPAIIRMARKAEEDYNLGDTGIVVEKGKVVSIPIYAIHHDPDIYPEPEKFNPERFSTEAKAKRHPYAYLAFGAGPRNCVGMRFALMEAKLCIAYMVSQFIIKQCSEIEMPPCMCSPIGLMEPKEILLCFEERKGKIFDGLQENQGQES